MYNKCALLKTYLKLRSDFDYTALLFLKAIPTGRTEPFFIYNIVLYGSIMYIFTVIISLSQFTAEKPIAITLKWVSICLLYFFNRTIFHIYCLESDSVKWTFTLMCHTISLSHKCIHSWRSIDLSLFDKLHNQLIVFTRVTVIKRA